MPRITSTSGHDRHRVHEVHPDEAVRPARRRGQARDRDRGRVRGEDRLRPADRVELAEELLLDGLVLDDRLDDGVGGRREPPSSVVVVRRPRAAALSSARPLSLRDLAVEVLLDRGAGLLEKPPRRRRRGRPGNPRPPRRARSRRPSGPPPTTPSDRISTGGLYREDPAERHAPPTPSRVAGSLSPVGASRAAQNVSRAQRRRVPKRETRATPTATIDATLQTSAPTNGRSETPPSTAKPAASAAGRRAGATLLTSFWPTSRKSAAMPKTFADDRHGGRGERDRDSERRRQQRQRRAGREKERQHAERTRPRSEPDQSSLGEHRRAGERRREEPEQRERHGEPRARARADGDPDRTERAEGALLPGRAPHLGEVEVQERAGRRHAALDRRHGAPLGKLDVARRRRRGRPRPRRPGANETSPPQTMTSPDDARCDADVGKHRDDAAGEILGNDDVAADRGDGARDRAGGAGEAEEEEPARTAKSERRPRPHLPLGAGSARQHAGEAQRERRQEQERRRGRAPRPAASPARAPRAPSGRDGGGRPPSGRRSGPARGADAAAAAPSEACSEAVRAGRASRARPGERRAPTFRRTGRVPEGVSSALPAGEGPEPGDPVGEAGDQGTGPEAPGEPLQSLGKVLAATISAWQPGHIPGVGGGVGSQERLGAGGNRLGVNRIQGARATVSRQFSSQPVLQYDSGPKEFVLHGPEGHFLDLGDLLVGQAGKVAQGDELPKVGGKLLDRPVDGLPPLDVAQLPVGVEPSSTVLDGGDGADAAVGVGRSRAAPSGDGACAGGRSRRCPRSGRARSRTCRPG